VSPSAGAQMNVWARDEATLDLVSPDFILTNVHFFWLAKCCVRLGPQLTVFHFAERYNDCELRPQKRFQVNALVLSCVCDLLLMAL
jgi:hypothetical protein